MAEYFQLNDEIEAACARIYARRPDFKCAVNDPILGRSMRYKADRNASATVWEVLYDEDKKRLKSPNSHIEIYDKLRADAIEFLCAETRKRNWKVSEGASSTHGGNFFDTQARTYAIISTPFQNLMNVFENKKKREEQKLIENKQKLIK